MKHKRRDEGKKRADVRARVEECILMMVVVGEVRSEHDDRQQACATWVSEGF